MKARYLILPLVLVVALVVGTRFVLSSSRPDDLVLTGVVTTDDVVVSPQVAGRLDSLTVDAGDSVRAGQLLAVIEPAELAADRSFYTHTADAVAAQVTARQADLEAAEAQAAEARATLDKTRRTFQRDSSVVGAGGITQEALDQARAAADVAGARANAAEKQVAAARSALAAAQQQRDAASAQVDKADVRLGYSEVRAPIPGIVDVRAATRGEVVNAGQPIVTLVDPNDLWVRADVEESYIDRIRLGDTLRVRLPSGQVREGRVFYRGVDADYATQRDVSRTKRDIKTFEVRLRVDNRDRRLAVGMTAYVLLPVSKVSSS